MRRLAVAVAAAASLLVPAAAQARTDDLDKTILLVAGPERASASCRVWDDVLNHVSEYTTSVDGRRISYGGNLVSVGLYAGADACFENLEAPRDATIPELGAKLAAFIKRQYTAKGEAVDIVAHGGGGLIVRAALDVDTSLRVEDAVTVGTPHTGSAALARACGSRAVCAQLAPGSALLKSLGKNPQGKGGTDWSAIGSDRDTEVDADSATGMDAAHRTVYIMGGPTHDGLLQDRSPKDDAHIRYSHGQGEWKIWHQAPHSLNRIAENLVFGVSPEERSCGLQATQPDLCGKTPVILVPGFGASQLDCGTAAKPDLVWPGAATKPWRFETLALAGDGRSPLEADDACAAATRPNGHVLDAVAGSNIHGQSWAWLQRIAPGRAYEFGWDFRKGPDQTVDRLDAFIDDVRARHGVTRVALVAHSYGGILSRWYIDDARRASKVARVANFGSPWWGAAKAWFALAYGYETPAFSPLDLVTSRDTFKVFTRNLTGLYYLIPPKAWIERAPAPLRHWLEVDDRPVRSVDGVADAVRQFGGNGGLVQQVADRHERIIDGFTRANGVDWRIFIGSGLPTLGHVRAYSGTDEVQYSWINGDGTVPLFSQRQSATAGGDQMGDDVPTYNFCDVVHMAEMEEPALQDATAGFIAEGTDPVVDGTTLRRDPCTISAVEFRVTKKEDARSLEISSLANALPQRVRAKAARGSLSLAEAEAAGLIEVMRDAGKTVFVTNRDVQVRATGGSGLIQVTPLTGEGKRGTAKVYDLRAGLDITAAGAQASATADGLPVKGRAADTRAPRTRAKLRRGKLTLRARDASGVAATIVKVGKARPRPYKRALKIRGKATVRYWSIDTFGNVERKRTLRR